MIEQDYILKILEQFFQAIAKVVRRKDADDSVDNAWLQERFDEMYEQFFRNKAEHFYQSDKEDITDDLWNTNSEKDAYAKMQMLAELLYQDARIKEDVVERCNLFEKSLYLLTFIAQNSRTYSWERERKMADIKQQLEEYEIK